MKRRQYFKSFRVYFLTMVLLISLCNVQILSISAKSNFVIKKGVLLEYNGASKNITIPKGVKKIGSGVFKDNKKVESITFPSSLKEIGNNAFLNCKNLKKVKLNNGLKKIGTMVFYGCNKITSISIPFSVKTIYSASDIGVTFIGCKGLKKITVSSKNPYYKSVDGILYNKKKTKLICYPAAKNQSTFTIPKTVATIGAAAFSHTKSLKSVSLHNKILELGDGAFSSTGITSIVLPNGIKVGNGVFSYCTNLNEVTFNGKFSLGIQSFSHCTALTSINLPEGSSYINDSFFFCTSLKTVSLPSTLEYLIDAFERCTAIENIEIPAGIKEMNSSFMHCTNLKTVTIKNKNIKIGQYSFIGCSKDLIIYGYTGSTAEIFAKQWGWNFVEIQ